MIVAMQTAPFNVAHSSPTSRMLRSLVWVPMNRWPSLIAALAIVAMAIVFALGHNTALERAPAAALKEG